MTNAAMRRSMRNLDDDDEDINDFDPAYFPRKVYKDGRGPRVRLMLTDSAPPAPRAALYDASHHRPRSAVIDAADPHVREAERAYYDRNKWLQDAWKTPSGQIQPPPDDDDDDDGSPLSARDEYIRRTSNMWREPIGNGYGSSEADAIQRAFMRRITPGARPGDEPDAIEAARRRRGTPGPPGVTFGHGPTKDAAAGRALADAAYREYCDRISNGWRK